MVLNMPDQVPEILGILSSQQYLIAHPWRRLLDFCLNILSCLTDEVANYRSVSKLLFSLKDG